MLEVIIKDLLGCGVQRLPPRTISGTNELCMIYISHVFQESITKKSILLFFSSDLIIESNCRTWKEYRTCTNISHSSGVSSSTMKSSSGTTASNHTCPAPPSLTGGTSPPQVPVWFSRNLETDFYRCPAECFRKCLLPSFCCDTRRRCYWCSMCNHSFPYGNACYSFEQPARAV